MLLNIFIIISLQGVRVRVQMMSGVCLGMFKSEGVLFPRDGARRIVLLSAMKAGRF